MPGYKVFLEDGGEIREGLTCSYCKLVLKDPVQTSESGLRLCRRCFEEAKKDPSFSSELDPSDAVWPDSAVKREITNLRVKCENYNVGCDWRGLFKQLMQHSQECQYVTVECSNIGCGQQVMKAKMEAHLKEECLYRRVNCQDCGREMLFIDLQNHDKDCPNAPRTCKNCSKKVPASKLTDHMLNECKHVRCVCKTEKIFEAGSTPFRDHLKNVSKLADHLEPIICEFTKMSEAFKEMTVAYQLATKRIGVLEEDHQEGKQRIDTLEKYHEEDTQRIRILEEKNNKLEERVKQADKRIIFIENLCNDLGNKNTQLSLEFQDVQKSTALIPKAPSFNEANFQHLEQQFTQRIGVLEKNWGNLKTEIRDIKDSKSQLAGEVDELKRQYTVSIPSSKVPTFGGEMLPYERPSSGEVRQVEEKVLELERTLNVISVHHSELELQLQASLASTHNGAFLWRIPEVRRRIRDAKIGRITSIYSPPFYTGRNGYKMCIRAYLNGDGSGEGTHLSIFFVLMKGEYDPLLQWPFESKVSLILVDQDHMKHLVQSFKPNPQSSSFQKPKTDMNVASGCPEFADLSILDNTSYVKDDQMYIKAIVDISKIFHP